MLRFGIVPLEFKPIVDRIIVGGVPDFSRFNILDSIRNTITEYIHVVEITMDISHIIPHSLNEQVVSGLVRLQEELNIRYTVHLPLWSIELSSFNTHIREASVRCIVDSIKHIEPLEPEVYVLHATGALAAEFSRLKLPESMVQLICGYMSGHAIDSVRDILAITEIHPRRLAIENVEFPFTITRQIVDECDTSICFDTGHQLTRYSGTESVVDFYNRHHDRIIEIHLHDGSYKEMNGVPIHNDHIALGQGEMPVRDLLLHLINDRFKGPIVFELTAREVDESLKYLKRIVPEVFST